MYKGKCKWFLCFRFHWHLCYSQGPHYTLLLIWFFIFLVPLLKVAFILLKTAVLWVRPRCPSWPHTVIDGAYGWWGPRRQGLVKGAVLGTGLEGFLSHLAPFSPLPVLSALSNTPLPNPYVVLPCLGAANHRLKPQTMVKIGLPSSLGCPVFCPRGEDSD